MLGRGGVWKLCQHSSVDGRETQKANSLKPTSLQFFELLPPETSIIQSNASPVAKATEMKNSGKKLQWPDLIYWMECKMAQRNARNDLRSKSSGKTAENLFVLLPQLPVSLDFLFRIFLKDEDGMLQLYKHCKTDISWKSLPEKNNLHFRTVID